MASATSATALMPISQAIYGVSTARMRELVPAPQLS